MRFRPGIFVVLAALGACSDDVAPPGTPKVEELVCTGGSSPGPAPVRRMTRFEYNNTVRDLLGDTSRPADAFGAEETSSAFNNNAVDLVTSPTLAVKYMRAAEGVAARATEKITALVGCDGRVRGDGECVP